MEIIKISRNEEERMKKIILLTIAAIIVLTAMLTGCGGQPGTSATPSAAQTSAAQTSSAAATSNGATAGGVKTGLGHDISIASSKSASVDKDNKPVQALAQSDTIMAAVTLDAQGKIVNVKFDTAQVKINFDDKGQLVTDAKTVPQTKVELGDNYGMKKASGIGKEWYQEIAALEDWMVGKTIDQVMAMKVTKKSETETSVPAEADLTSSVTISVAGFQNAVKNAADNAKDFGAAVSLPTKTGLGSVISITSSKSAGVDKDNKPTDALGQADVMMAAVTVDSTGKIVGVVIDTAQNKITFDAKGQLTTDIKTIPKTKLELGDNYGMKKASSIGKEWYQEIEALGKWMIGKTIDQVMAMKVTKKSETETSVPAEADLTSSVTISVQSFLDAVQKAVKSAD